MSGDWPKDFLVSFSLISHTGNIFARMLSKIFESKIEEVIEEDQFGFRKGKGLEMLLD